VRRPEQVGDAELFDVEQAGSGVVERPEDRSAPRTAGPALGGGGR
jgi:hypothetical protein